MVIREPVWWCSTFPITAVIADEMAKDRATQVTAGLDYLVPKPINTGQFVEAILRRLSKTKFRREQLVAALSEAF